MKGKYSRKSPEELYRENVHDRFTEILQEMGEKRFRGEVETYLDDIQNRQLITAKDIVIIKGLLAIIGRGLPHKSHKRWENTRPKHEVRYIDDPDPDPPEPDSKL